MPTVLIADDDSSIREILSIAFEKNGFTVRTAEDGGQAVAAIQEENIDLVILDVIMPEKGGLETLLEIRGEHPELKIILITGKIPTDISPFLNLKNQFKIEAVFTKPFEIMELVERAGELIGS